MLRSSLLRLSGLLPTQIRSLPMGMNSLKRGEEFYSPKVIEKMESIYIALLED